MSDLVKRLKDRANRKWTDEACRSASLFSEAADLIESLQAENKRLNDCLTYEQHRAERIGTHGPDCHTWGPQHYECAMREIVKLRVLIEQMKEVLADERYVSRYSHVVEALAAYDALCKESESENA